MIQPFGQSVVGEKSNYCPDGLQFSGRPAAKFHNATEKEPAAGESFPCTTLSSFSCVSAVAVQKRVVRLVSPHLLRARTSVVVNLTQPAELCCAVNNGHARNATVAVVERIGEDEDEARGPGRKDRKGGDGWMVALLCFPCNAPHPPNLVITLATLLSHVTGINQMLVVFFDRPIDRPARSSCLVFFFFSFFFFFFALSMQCNGSCLVEEVQCS